MPKIVIETFINANKEIVFNLSRSVDLHKISTKHTNEKAIAGKTEGLIEFNESVTWRAKHLGFYQNLTSKITSYKYPTYFCDEMQKGAFHSFKHEHIFSDKEKGTLMKDIFIYVSPFGILGKIADSVFLKKYMENLLIKRNQIIKEFAESDKWKEIITKD
ncbi:SRPBCC family protein [Polaribacter marinivivus]|uniref:Cell division protein n=1 Tax=Polaribacter marinivivus TaxID=1524260 RepID=A0ABV8R7H9_9FLAO